MGIQGLLPLFKSTMQPIHIKDLQGCSVAVDTYSWLHKGALSCSTDLCKGLPTSRHIEYCMHRVNLLRHYGVKPVLVFDGGFLPMKLEQENKRARSRKENLARAIEHEANGNSSAAYECYQKAVDISPSIAHDLIQVLKQENVSYVVAPYEADAQMTFLAVNKQVDAVITEDSDLIAFGCPRIIFKMDKYGQGVEFQYSRLHKNRELCFAGFTNQMVLEMCILSGCDYLQSLPGMGLKRAHALISKFKSYEKVIKHLRYSTITIPPLYEESFRRAILTFQHQRVYDLVSEDIVHLFDVPESQGGYGDFLGPPIPQDVAKGIAKGDLDPFTQMPFQGGNETSAAVLSETSKVKTSKPGITAKKIDLPVQKNLLTNYFCFASIEAKRKFKAPRKSPMNPSPLDMSSLKEHCHAEADAGRISCASRSTLNSEKLSTISPHAMESESDLLERHGKPTLSEPPNSLLEKQSMGYMPQKAFGQSLNQSGQAVLKECESKNNQCTAQGIMQRADCIKVIVRSRYFQHKAINKDSQETIEERGRFSENVSTDLSKENADLILSGMSERKAKATALSMQESLLNVDEDSEEQGVEREKVIVRSRYFQHKAINKDSQETIEERGRFSENVSTDLSKENADLILSGMSERKAKATALSMQERLLNVDADSEEQGVERKKVIVRSRYFQHKPISKDIQESMEERGHHRINNVSCNLSKENGDLSLSAMSEKSANAAESRQESLIYVDVDSEEQVVEHKKDILRSRYFQHKPINKDSQDTSKGRTHCNNYVSSDLSKADGDLSLSDTTEKKANVAESRQESLLEGNIDIDRDQEGSALGIAGLGEKNSKDRTLKRKTSQNDNVYKAKRRSKYFCTNASLSSSLVEFGGGCSSFEADEELAEKVTGGKFGANIEHLSQYSKIAEKSVDKFASMLSSYRYSSSGSRASGLRAPLKDIKNTCANRPTTVPDFTKFAYTPKIKGTAASSTRR